MNGSSVPAQIKERRDNSNYCPLALQQEFGQYAAMPIEREQLKAAASELASQSIYVGTSSWKYPGWIGGLYNRERYEYHGKFSNSRFDRDSLQEYAEVFKTVCVDAAYYDFPRPDSLKRMGAAVPDDFRFGFKVTSAITHKTFPNLPRYNRLAGRPNPEFLNANLFVDAFLRPCEEIRDKVGILMFEFSRFWPSDYTRGRDFVADLDAFLAKLPKNWPYGVELRNDAWLTPEYFDCLSRHKVTHVFNSWEAMRPVNEQMDLPGSETNPALVAARFLLKPGRKYEDAVKIFQPYDKLREVNDEARLAAVRLIQAALKARKEGKRIIFVNNRLEGNALATLLAIVEMALEGKLPKPPPQRPTTLF